MRKQLLRLLGGKRLQIRRGHATGHPATLAFSEPTSSIQSTTLPCTHMSIHPSSNPSIHRPSHPPTHPTIHPASQPSTQPPIQPADQPVARLTNWPSARYAVRPSTHPTLLRSSFPPSFHSCNQQSNHPPNHSSCAPASVPAVLSHLLHARGAPRRPNTTLESVSEGKRANAAQTPTPAVRSDTTRCRTQTQVAAQPQPTLP